MKTILKLTIILLASLFLFSCEEVIDIKLDQGESQLAVDALLAVENGPQKIRLTLSRPYFENKTADAVSGAELSLVRKPDGKVYSFSESSTSPGDYFSSEALEGMPLNEFELSIKWNGNEFRAVSMLPRKQVIDSLRQGYRESEFGNEPGTYLDLYANDLETNPSYRLPDFFWLRYSLNGVKNLRLANILVGSDAAFRPGVADGLPYIYPVRNSINTNKPYLVGDSIEVELYSIDAENFRFLTEMQTQLTNTGLFAQPAANVKGNIVNVNLNSKVQAIGNFGVCQLSKAGIKVK